MHIYLTGHLPDCKTAVSSDWTDTWTGEKPEKVNLDKEDIITGQNSYKIPASNFFSFQKQVCPKQMLHHRFSSLKIRTCMLSVQEHPGTTGQNLRFWTSQHLAQALSSAAFQLPLPELTSQAFSIGFNKPPPHKHSFAKSQHWGIRQAKLESMTSKPSTEAVGMNSTLVSPFRTI